MNPWVDFSYHYDITAAHLVKGRIESSGIPAFIPEEHQARFRIPIHTAIRTVRVQVPRECYDAALDALGNIGNGTHTEMAAEPERCAACRSTNLVAHRSLALDLLAFITLGLSEILPACRYRVICRSCGFYLRE